MLAAICKKICSIDSVTHSSAILKLLIYDSFGKKLGKMFYLNGQITQNRL